MSLILVACTAQQNNAEGGSATDGEPRRGKLSTNFTLDELRELAEENKGEDVGSVEVSGIHTMKKDFKQINNQMMLFEEPIRNEDERFNRLETVVQDIHSELSDFKPGIKRLLAIETDIKELHSKLSQLVRQETFDVGTSSANMANSAANNAPEPRRLSLGQGQSSPARAQPEPAMTVTEEEEEPLPNTVQADVEAESVIAQQQEIQREIEDYGGMPVTIRAWQSPDKTRIVFETPRKADYTIAFDKQAGEVTIQTEQKFSPAQAKALVTTSKQILGAIATENSATEISVLSLAVDGVSSISKGYYLSPQNETQDHRYYFDLYK